MESPYCRWSVRSSMYSFISSLFFSFSSHAIILSKIQQRRKRSFQSRGWDIAFFSPNRLLCLRMYVSPSYLWICQFFRPMPSGCRMLLSEPRRAGDSVNSETDSFCVSRIWRTVLCVYSPREMWPLKAQTEDLRQSQLKTQKELSPSFF